MSTSPTPPTRHRDAPGHDPSRHWGTSPTPPGPKPKHRGRILLADQEPAETVISQSPTAGAWVLPDTTVKMMVAKTPPPPPSTAPPPPTAPEQDCDPSYPDVCLDPAVEDYDCAGGTGNGPEYVEGPIRVLPPDPFDLDREGDGVGCESG